MKTLRLFYIGIFAMACVSCGHDNIVNGAPPMFAYHLELGFHDAEGNDLVKGIKTIPLPEHAAEGEAKYVDYNQYTLVSSPDKNDLGYFSNPTAIYDDTYPYPRPILIFPNKLVDGDGPEYHRLWINDIASSPIEPHVEKITYTLTCPHIFGDDKPHEIITYWGLNRYGNNSRVYCTRVVFDDKELPFSFLDEYKSCATVTIIVDR